MLGLGIGLGFNRVIGAPLLLDKFTGAAAAYSLRALSSTTTDVVRVRRSSDNAEQDFSPDEITDGSLAIWVGAGNDGFVTTWYDQAGSNDATQATASAQPKIVDTGVLVEDNGKAAIDFDGVDDSFNVGAFGFASASAYSLFSVINRDEQGVFFSIQYLGSDDNRHTIDDLGTGRLFVTTDDGTATTVIASDIGTGQKLATFINDDVNSTIYINSAQEDQIADDLNYAGYTESANSIGSRLRITQFFESKMQEHILYLSDQSSNRGNIEANVNNHYSIY